MLALGSFDNSTGQNTTVRQDTLKGAGLNGPQNRGNPGRWCQSHKRPLPSIGNLLSAEVPTDVWFTDESGATKKVSYIKIKADERGSAIIRSLTPLPTSNELNRSPENTLIPYHFLSLVSFARSAADAVEGCNVGRQNCSVNPITTGLIDLIFFQNVSKRFTILHSDRRFLREIEGGGLRSDNRRQHQHQNPQKSVSIAKRTKRKPRADSPQAVNPQHAGSL
jgi:hypothetical protein